MKLKGCQQWRPFFVFEVTSGVVGEVYFAQFWAEPSTRLVAFHCYSFYFIGVSPSAVIGYYFFICNLINERIFFSCDFLVKTISSSILYFRLFCRYNIVLVSFFKVSLLINYITRRKHKDEYRNKCKYFSH